MYKNVDRTIMNQKEWAELVFWFLILALFVFLSMPVKGQTHVLLNEPNSTLMQAVDVYQGAPDDNNNDDPALSVLDSNQGIAQRIYLQFNHTLRPTDEVLEAYIHVYRELIHPGGAMLIGVHYVHDTFDTRNITWNNQPCGAVTGVIGGTCNGTREDSFNTPLPNVWERLNVTESLQRAVRLNRNLTVVLATQEGNGPGSDLRHDFNRSGYDINFDDSRTPVLNITYNLGTPDNTPPNILSINLSSEGTTQLVNLSDKLCEGTGCVLPTTPDLTPTIRVITNEDAFCAFRDP